jgi:hypothetical protein
VLRSYRYVTKRWCRLHPRPNLLLIETIQTFNKSGRFNGVPHTKFTLLFQKVAAGIFVEGFAAAKKCTNEGRALMQLDHRQFVLKAEALSGLRPLPYQAYVSAYVKASVVAKNIALTFNL